MKRIAAIVALMVLFAFGAASAQTSSDPHLLKAKDLRSQAQAAFDKGDYDGAAALVAQAKSELKLVVRASPAPAPAAAPAPEPAPPPVPVVAAPPPPAGPDLPATYKVRYLPGNRDCLWKIAAYTFVYNDPEKWRILYKANKDRLRQPDNPDLINPDIILDIPSIDGETRSGAYDPDQTYPAFIAK